MIPWLVHELYIVIDDPQALASGLSPIQIDNHGITRGSYMSPHFLLNLLNQFKKSDEILFLPSILSHFLNSLIQEHNVRLYLSHDIKIA